MKAFHTSRLSRGLIGFLVCCGLLLGAGGIWAACVESGSLEHFQKQTSYAATFSDVQPGDWFYDSVKTAYENIDFSVQNGKITVSAEAPQETITVTKAEQGRLELALNGVPESLLIGAVYNGTQMVASAMTYIPAGATSAVVDFRRTFPEACTYKAFVLDKTDFRPLLPAAKLTP